MQRIFKFPVLDQDRFQLEIPEGAEFLSLQTQSGTPQMWFKVDEHAAKQRRRFLVAGTGHYVVPSAHFLGTFQLDDGARVFHVFEV